MVFLSIFNQFLGAIVMYLLAKSLSLELSLGLIFLVIPIIGIASMCPSLNGLGPREWAYVYYLGPIVGEDKAGAMAILWFSLLLINSLIGGLVYVLQPRKIKLAMVKNNIKTKGRNRKKSP